MIQSSATAKGVPVCGNGACQAAAVDDVTVVLTLVGVAQPAMSTALNSRLVKALS